MLFFKNKKLENLQEQPLGYWEQESYMLAILENEEELNPTNMLERIKKIEGVKVESNDFNVKEGRFYMTLKYEEETYKVGLYPCGFSIPKLYLTSSNYRFTEEEIEKIKNAKMALTICMEFGKNAPKSFHLQIKIAVAMVPNLLGLVDESAEKLFPSKWVRLLASSKIEPSASDLFSTQVVSQKENEVWLHTHGLCRCHQTELEILKSDKENYLNHSNLLNAYASYIIDQDDSFSPREQSTYIGILSDRTPIVVTCKSWTEALKEYKNLKLGGISDRAESHNSKTSPIFIYKSEEDEKNRKVSKISDYNHLFGDNPVYFFSNAETARMQALARERFDYVKRESQKRENEIMIKIGLPTDNHEVEHIWFKLIKFEKDKFLAELTQEPYNISKVHEKDQMWFTLKDVTDWIIYTPKFQVNPSNVYLL